MGKPGYTVTAGIGDARRRRRAGDAGVAARRRRSPPRDAVPDRGARRAARRRARRGARRRGAGRPTDWRRCCSDEARRIGFEERFLHRPLNVDLSGGEKKRNETLQLAVLRPKIAILDELDSRPRHRRPPRLRPPRRGDEQRHAATAKPLGVLAITHYSRLLTELRPDHVHILVKGRIVARGGAELADHARDRRLRRVRARRGPRRAAGAGRGPAASTSCSHSDRGGMILAVADVIDELKGWLDANWDPDMTVGEWWERLGMAGWSAPSLPAESYGRGVSRNDAVRVAETIAAHGALAAPGGLGLLLAAPTIATHGTREQIDQLRRRHRHRPQGVVPAVQRAGRRQRPRRAADACRSRRRRVDRQRAEGVDVVGPRRRSRDADRPHRLRRARSTRASPTSRSTCTSRASRCGRCAR